MKLHRILALIACALLLSCGGGGGGGEAAPPGSPVATEPAIALAAESFYPQAGTVLVGQTVRAVASLPPGFTPQWRVAQAPGTSPPVVLVPEPGAPERVGLFVDFVGTYRLELVGRSATGTTAPVSATFVSIPSQIEYAVDVRHAGGTTTIEVSGGVAQAPMAACLVYWGGGCRAPAAVDVFLDAVVLGTLNAPNSGGADHPSYTFTLPTASLGSQRHALRVNVQAPVLAGPTRGREGFVAFDAASPAQLRVSGTVTTDVSSSVELHVVQPPVVELRVGKTVAVWGSSFSARRGVDVVGATMRVIDKPAGSTAALAATMQPPLVATMDRVFVADKPGPYTVEYTPVLADGSRAEPKYATLVALPHELSFVLNASSASLDYEAVPPDSVRVAVQVASDRVSDRLPVTLSLDGASVGTLTQANVCRIVPRSSGLFMSPCVPAYAFDIPAATLGAGAHTARVVLVDVNGMAHEGSLTFSAGTDARASFGPFTDPNP